MSSPSFSFASIAFSMSPELENFSRSFRGSISKYSKNFGVNLMSFVRPLFSRVMSKESSRERKWSYALLVRTFMTLLCKTGALYATTASVSRMLFGSSVLVTTFLMMERYFSRTESFHAVPS